MRIDSPAATAVAVGYFDGVHAGHRAVIDEALRARREGLSACVFSFSTERSVLPDAKQGAKLLMTPSLKTRTIERMGVDWLLRPDFTLFKGLTPEQFAVDVLYHGLGARIVCCGYDYRFGKGAAAGPLELAELLTPLGVTVLQVGAVLYRGEPVSSTRIRAALAQGNCREASDMLGRPYTVDFPVVHGRGLGHRLGFPTANQTFGARYLAPRYGVYVTRVRVGEESFPAVTNVGVKPTVGSDCVSAESWLDGFSGDLYDRVIETEFLAFLRPEQKFASVEALREAVARDRDRARSLYARLGL